MHNRAIIIATLVVVFLGYCAVSSVRQWIRTRRVRRQQQHQEKLYQKGSSKH